MLIIKKIKLSGDNPALYYSRALPSGLVEQCELNLRPIPADLDGAMQELLSDAIGIIGLDDDRWNNASVSGMTFKHEDDGLGFTATLINRKEDGEGTVAICVNTPYLNAARADCIPGLADKLNQVCRVAVRFIETQPKQLDLLKAA